jgi:hypothetical protein
MEMRHYLKIFHFILREKEDCYEVFLSYLKILIKAYYYQKIKRKFSATEQFTFTIRIMNFDISFFSYPVLLSVFEEIFIDEVYALESNSLAPFIVDCVTTKF